MSDIKLYHFPVLAPGRTDYATSTKYEATPESTSRDREFCVTHRLSGTSLISQLVTEKSASFGCIVSLSQTMYRKTLIVEDSGLECRQTVDYSSAGCANTAGILLSQPKFQPIIVIKKNLEKVVDPEDGLSAFWLNRRIAIEEGSILAFSDWYGFGSGKLEGILLFKSDDSIETGVVKVSDHCEGDFRFEVKVSKEFLQYIRANEHSAAEHFAQVKSIKIHALSAGFALLHHDREYSEQNAGEEEYTNLQSIGAKLAEAGVSHWSDPDFDPAEAATTLYPHQIQSASDYEDE